MFTETRLVFYHCVSPVHLGSGTALGVIDNLIQRERHTGHPVFAGSGVKGALRHHAQSAGADRATLEAVFGPESQRDTELYAGAVSFTDAQLLLFPVRSAHNAFVYVTCPLALATARRLGVADLPEVTVRDVQDADGAEALVPVDVPGGRLALELFDYHARQHKDAATVASTLSGCFPAGAEWEFFRRKVGQDLAILSDSDFNYFVRNATSVEPHVAIDDATGAADGGKLFYTENLPPESVLVGLLMASSTRVPKRASASRIELSAMQAADFAAGAAGGMVQLGGDATTGRGQVVMRFARRAAAAGGGQ